MPETTVARSSLSTTPDANDRRLLIALSTTVVFLYWVSLYLYVPALPTYAESKSSSLATVGVVLAQYGLWQAIVRFPLGLVADWLGRRKLLIIVGLALAGLGALIMGLAESVNWLIAGRAITGLAAGTWVLLVVMFNDLFPRHESVRATAILTFAGSVGRILATGVTGVLNDLGGYSLAYFLATGVAVLGALVVIPTREIPRPPRRPSIEGVGRLITRRDVLLPSLLAAVSQYANWATTFGFVPILAQQLGGTGFTQSALLSMNLGAYTLGNLLAPTVANRIDARRLVLLSYVLLAVGIGGMAVASSLPVLFAAQVCIGLSQGVSAPVLMGMSIQFVPDSDRNTAMGLHQAVYAIGMFVGPALSGVLASAVGIRPMFGVTAAGCFLLGLFASRWLDKRRPE